MRLSRSVSSAGEKPADKAGASAKATAFIGTNSAKLNPYLRLAEALDVPNIKLSI